jgi:hypothetical protein
LGYRKGSGIQSRNTCSLFPSYPLRSIVENQKTARPYLPLLKIGACRSGTGPNCWEQSAAQPLKNTVVLGSPYELPYSVVCSNLVDAYAHNDLPAFRPSEIERDVVSDSTTQPGQAFPHTYYSEASLPCISRKIRNYIPVGQDFARRARIHSQIQTVDSRIYSRLFASLISPKTTDSAPFPKQSAKPVLV